MNHSNTHHRWIRTAICGLALGFTATLSAAEPAAAPLGGPEVKDRDVPGTPGSFGKPGAENRRMRENLPPNAIRRAVEDVIGQDAPEATRGTSEQREKIQNLVKEHETAVREYMNEHRKELDELRGGERRRGGRGGPEGDKKPAETAGSDAERDAKREKLRDLMDGAPQQKDLLTKVWAELTPAQRDAADKKLNEVRERLAKEREDRYVNERVGKRGEGKNDTGFRGDGPGPKGAGGGPNGEGPGKHGVSPERHERLMRLFERMPPEMQDEVLRRMEERLRDGGIGAPGRPGRPGRGGEGGKGGRAVPPPPPPAMDDVPMPPPESMDDDGMN